jgi:acetyltransferase-like isoleucine patch superfamily enzyme
VSSSRSSKRVGSAALGVYRVAVRLRNKMFSTAIRGAFGSFGDRSVIELPVRLVGEKRISIGSRVFIGSGAWLQVIGPDDESPALIVGDGTSMAGGCVVSAVQRVTIGRGVLIARNVYIADHGHAFEGIERPVLEQGVTGVAAVEIGDGAWLGENVVVCPGVRIGRGAVIGANAVVLRDVPEYSVAVGAPARVVRTFGPTASAAP